MSLSALTPYITASKQEVYEMFTPPLALLEDSDNSPTSRIQLDGNLWRGHVDNTTKPISKDLTGIQSILDFETIEMRAREIITDLVETCKKNQYKQVPLFLTIMNGALPWSRSLLLEWEAQTGFEAREELIGASSYVGTESTGEVKLTAHPFVTYLLNHQTEGLIVLIEDIIETGKTIDKVSEFVRQRSKAKLGCISLLRKCVVNDPAKIIKCPVQMFYTGQHATETIAGFDVDQSIFTVGYGMDLDGRYRDLPFVGQKVS